MASTYLQILASFVNSATCSVITASFYFLFCRIKMGESPNVTSDVCWKASASVWASSSFMNWWPRLIHTIKALCLTWISWTDLSKEKLRLVELKLVFSTYIYLKNFYLPLTCCLQNKLNDILQKLLKYYNDCYLGYS